jgi:GatB domain
MKAYFPPHTPSPVLPSQHPLFKELSETTVSLETVRELLLQLIATETIQTQSRDGHRTLEKFFLGKLMKQFRGKVSPAEITKLLHEEIDLHYEITPPTRKGGYFIVKRRIP